MNRRDCLLLLLAAACLLSALGLEHRAVRQAAEGHLVYSADDPYVHMAMAKNLVRHGVLGITSHGFTSASSSLLWTGLLAAAYGLTGVRDVTPLVLNVAAALAAAVVFPLTLRRAGLGRAGALLATLALLFGAPLSVLVFASQEHVLHVLLSLVFVDRLARALASRGPLGATALLAALLVLARYEGLFLVGLGALLLWVRRGFRPALAVGLAALLPVSGFGVYSVAQGWYFLPNSVLTKGNLPRLDSPAGLGRFLGGDLLHMAVQSRCLPVLMAGALVGLGVLLGRKGPWSCAATALALFTGTALLHLQLARTGAFYRYDAYLIALAVQAYALGARELGPLVPRPLGPLPAAAAAATALVVWAPVGLRSLEAHRLLPRAVRNIYEQQYQMARFVDRYYRGEVVALNDVGLVNWRSDIRCVDLWGLASQEAARLRLRRRHDIGHLEAMAREQGARIAITYFGLPAPWRRVGTWTIRGNVVCAWDAVSFYARDEAGVARLAGSLEDFAPELPASVTRTPGDPGPGP